uniref:Uncharacterized protein n=1 Tax=Aegilops tauschii subsp. strangulata TaxID=200361 RepID=A0A453CYL6_AEGTS
MPCCSWRLPLSASHLQEFTGEWVLSAFGETGGGVCCVSRSCPESNHNVPTLGCNLTWPWHFSSGLLLYAAGELQVPKRQNIPTLDWK